MRIEPEFGPGWLGQVFTDRGTVVRNQKRWSGVCRVCVCRCSYQEQGPKNHWCEQWRQGSAVPRWPSARWRARAQLAHAGALAPLGARSGGAPGLSAAPHCPLEPAEILRPALQLLCHRDRSSQHQAQHYKHAPRMEIDMRALGCPHATCSARTLHTRSARASLTMHP